jgi:hypothetical protein
MANGQGRGYKGNNSRRYKNQNVEFVKLFYQIIQAIHHINVLRQQAKGEHRTKGFDTQVRYMDRFLKPAQSNPRIISKLQNLNRTWATKIAQTLTEHYKERISELMGMIVGYNFADWTIKTLSHQALDWAKKNLRRKLKLESIQEFQSIIKTLSPGTTKNINTINSTSNSIRIQRAPNPNTNPNPNPNQTNEPGWIYKSPKSQSPRKYPLEPTVVAITLSNRFLPLDTQPIRTPSKRRMSHSPISDTIDTPKRQRQRGPTPEKARKSLGDKFTTPTKSPAKNFKVLPSVKPLQNVSKCKSVPSIPSLISGLMSRSPSPVRRSLSPRSSPSGSPSIPNQSYAAVVKCPKKPGQITRHNSQKADWALPKITFPTLVIGDSNLARITNVSDKQIQVEAFPGANILHVTQLLQNYRYDEQPQRIIISIGINNRGNMNTNKTCQEMKQLLKIAREKFQDCEICVTKIPISEQLQVKNSKEAWNIKKLNECLSKMQMNGITVLNTGIANEVTFHQDGIHWSPRSANLILKDWLEQIESRTQGFPKDKTTNERT